MQALGMVGLLGMSAGEVLPADVLGEMQTALMGFIQSGGVISAGLLPSTPVTLMDMITPEGGFNAEASGLTFSHDAP